MPDEPSAFVAMVRAEIEAEAEMRRRRDPELRRLEREIERAWVEVAPPGATGDQRELLLDRADRLAMIDVDVPLGDRRGVRQMKGAIRKGTYWYLRYVSDQLNALNNVITRLLRRLDGRLSDVESALQLGSNRELLSAPPQPSPDVAAAVAAIFSAAEARRVAVVSAGGGEVVAALHAAGIRCYGIETDPLLALKGVQLGLDLRAGSPFEHLAELNDGEIDGLVLTGEVENMAIAALWRTIGHARRVVASGGTVVVAAADPAHRETVERELRAGRGISSESWCHLFSRTGSDTEIVPSFDVRIPSLVVARIP